MLVFAAFFLLPLVFVAIVSAWNYNEYEMLPAFSFRGYSDTFEGCITGLPELCTILKTYAKTVKLCFLTWAITLVVGFTVAYFSPFISVRKPGRSRCRCSVRFRFGPRT